MWRFQKSCFEYGQMINFFRIIKLSENGIWSLKIVLYISKWRENVNSFGEFMVLVHSVKCKSHAYYWDYHSNKSVEFCSDGIFKERIQLVCNSIRMNYPRIILIILLVLSEFRIRIYWLSFKECVRNGMVKENTAAFILILCRQTKVLIYYNN